MQADWNFSSDDQAYSDTQQGVPSIQVILEWDPNTEPDLDGYRIYYGEASGIYSKNIDIGNTTTCTVVNLERGKTYYFAATAYNILGLESDFSTEVSYDVPL
jgi:fibronectin type 3 domain-containing protein